jgi:enoyl-CoA hydratase
MAYDDRRRAEGEGMTAMSAYGLPDSLTIESHGAVRVVRLDRPDELNAVDAEMHEGLSRLFWQFNEDTDVRAVVVTGRGTTFSAGGEFSYIKKLTTDPDLRRRSMGWSRRLVLGMVQSRVPIIAAVNGPAVGVACSMVSLSDIVYMSSSAHLCDPHVAVGLVAADGGPVSWPQLMSLMHAKEYSLTAARISAETAARIGLVNHICEPGMELDAALLCAQRIAAMPAGAVEATRRVLNLHLEHAVLATIDFAAASETSLLEGQVIRDIIAAMSAS